MAKRGNGEGSIYQRKSNGRWEGSITLPDSSRKMFYGKKRSEVAEKINMALADQRRGMLPTMSSATVQEYIVQWLEEVHKPTVKLSTYNNYEKLVRLYIVPVLGRIKLQSLTPQHVQTFYSKKLKEGLSAKSISNIHELLHKAFNKALKEAGLPHIRFHDLRQSAATILLSRGTHPKVVQEILGHSQISMTLDVYSHVLPSMQGDVTKRWDDDFGTGVPVPVK